MNTGSPSGGTPGAGQEDPAGEATVLRMLLGAQLCLREAAGISAEKAGYEIRASRSKISRVETGRAGLKVRDIEDLLTIYGVADEGERVKVLALARRSREPEWWTQYTDILPDWFETYLRAARQRRLPGPARRHGALPGSRRPAQRRGAEPCRHDALPRPGC